MFLFRWLGFIFVTVYLLRGSNAACPLLPKVKNAIFRATPRQFSRYSYNTDTIVRYFCIVPDFMLSGGNTRTCLSSGKWTPEERNVCIPVKARSGAIPGARSRSRPVSTGRSSPRCKQPDPIPDGSFQIRGGVSGPSSKGSRLYYRCDQGYSLVGRARRKCNKKLKWGNKSPPFCKKNSVPDSVECSQPGTPTYSRRFGQCCRAGSNLTFICMRGFQLVGGKSITCGSNGIWSSSVPTCVASNVCDNPGQVTNAERTTNTKKSNIFKVGDQVIYKCKSGYYFNTWDKQVVMTCGPDGYWDDVIGDYYCEEFICSSPIAPRNGKLVESNKTTPYHVGDTVHYMCNKGYILSGTRERTCSLEREGWTERQPRCKRIRCPDPRWPVNGRRIGNSFSVGDQVHFLCFGGFYLLGSKTRWCSEDGHWNGTIATCKKTVRAADNICADPGYIADANRTSLRKHRQFKANDKVIYTCNHGYQFNRRGTKVILTCRADGYWTNVISDYSCKVTGCTNPGVPDNGYKHGKRYYVNDIVRFTCMPGFQRTGPYSRRCLPRGQWSGKKVSCVVK